MKPKYFPLAYLLTPPVFHVLEVYKDQNGFTVLYDKYRLIKYVVNREGKWWYRRFT